MFEDTMTPRQATEARLAASDAWQEALRRVANAAVAARRAPVDLSPAAAVLALEIALLDAFGTAVGELSEKEMPVAVAQLAERADRGEQAVTHFLATGVWL